MILNLLLQVESHEQIKESLNSLDILQHQIWFWIALFELFLIAFLILALRRKYMKLPFSELSKDKLKKAKNAKIDMGNLMDSINGARQLFKELSKVCHPDKFVDPKKKILAERLFQEITRNKRNYGKLNQLKSKAENELNIKINF